ncbi:MULTISPECIES: hypothetical protein [unclassified Gordonia (in: high G+C Gram-positive bacteria)]|uniref:hypothetical protein n=1 Tax=unclassified Gordonia (in: high G+C Gram-positive bacteria) TaxID=2657482 RepID=UPI0007EACDAD|nr:MULTISPECIES: hypothetical protein [unclassified Gordonia (in: high G+C Gram-positive bacteria)]OBC05443.1 hypothetical protein A5785_13210 [Gordonia sp. 852002-50395_SCH5434458]OBC14005.1 hypothetical protein A5786_22900 [Gordonia sp. 852002-50816_SCH5313054-a]OBC19593.1 hypothetical protein A5788_08325 [Gordonia sp. 852002-50816_SCH5313054-c]
MVELDPLVELNPPVEPTRWSSLSRPPAARAEPPLVELDPLLELVETTPSAAQPATAADQYDAQPEMCVVSEDVGAAAHRSFGSTHI